MRTAKSGEGIDKDRAIAAEAWSRIAEGLSRSDNPEDRVLANHVDRFFSGKLAIDTKRHLGVAPEPQGTIQTVRQALTVVTRDREGPEIRR